ncbi:MAG TPA: 50S ribosomal protein L3 [Candidatus Megaira endosymbiont of Hartmannula sinica]|nr:50S ribosomal protein L3 [Candidatus Megaera endosymbiont of Hartmannula sinica]
MKRSGVIAKKIGMGSVFSKDGIRNAVTYLYIDNCSVVANKTEDKNGYNAVVVGSTPVKSEKISKPLAGMFSKLSVDPKKKLREFRVSSDSLIDVGSSILPSHYSEGQLVDVQGISSGKGFAGVMKRHNFAGLEATHGVSISHRSHGSTGQCQDPGRVFKGKKMAGHLGNEKVTEQNVRIVSVDDEKSIIVVKGSVPGHKGEYVYIRDAVKYS